MNDTQTGPPRQASDESLGASRAAESAHLSRLLASGAAWGQWQEELWAVAREGSELRALCPWCDKRVTTLAAIESAASGVIALAPRNPRHVGSRYTAQWVTDEMAGHVTFRCTKPGCTGRTRGVGITHRRLVPWFLYCVINGLTVAPVPRR